MYLFCFISIIIIKFQDPRQSAQGYICINLKLLLNKHIIILPNI